MNRKPNKSRASTAGSSKQPDRPPSDGQVELENQFVMRLPEEPAEALREAIRSGATNLKERLFIQLEPDKTPNNVQYLRRGHVQFDGWTFTSRLVDLPTIIESHKTIDNKNFYKTADICQLLICKEGDDVDEEESPVKKKKDPNKVDKIYRWPHGIGPPLKNCRKRRFRKTLRKKYVEAPEIEKEVKRLLRVDNESVSVKWEVITEDELNANKNGEAGKDNPDVKPSESGGFTNDPKELGLDLTDSENEEDSRDIDIDSEDGSRLSAGDDSRLSDSNMAGPSDRKSSPLLQFTKEMFSPNTPGTPRRHKASEEPSPRDLERMRQQEITLLHSRYRELEHNIANCPNEALRAKFQQDLQRVIIEIRNKEGHQEQS